MGNVKGKMPAFLTDISPARLDVFLPGYLPWLDVFLPGYLPWLDVFLPGYLPWLDVFLPGNLPRSYFMIIFIEIISLRTPWRDILILHTGFHVGGLNINITWGSLRGINSHLKRFPCLHRLPRLRLVGLEEGNNIQTWDHL